MSGIERNLNILFTVVNIDKLTYRFICNFYANRENNLQMVCWISVLAAIDILK